MSSKSVTPSLEVVAWKQRIRIAITGHTLEVGIDNSLERTSHYHGINPACQCIDCERESPLGRLRKLVHQITHVPIRPLTHVWPNVVTAMIQKVFEGIHPVAIVLFFDRLGYPYDPERLPLVGLRSKTDSLVPPHAKV